MAKMSVVTLGFLLTLVVYLFFGNYEFFGLMIVGFIVGYIAKDGILGGLWNVARAGSLGTIIMAGLFIIMITVGGTASIGILGGLVGFTFTGISSLAIVIYKIIYYAIVMGITGALGGAIARKD